MPMPPLKANPATEPDPVALVEIIELKWLMVGEGLRVHVERLQADPCYAQQILAMAEASSHSALRRLACRLRAKLQLPAGA
jgi:hypothetical protein